MALTKEQILLLNNLMYIDNESPLQRPEKNITVAEWLNNRIDINQIEDSKIYSSYTTGEDWKRTLQAVKNDPELMNLKIVTTHIDSAKGGGGGYSAVFTNESTKEAVVAFRGTADDEWKDNFTGGNVTDTEQQKNALKWYQETCKKYGLDQYEVTVTGHSKGGNKSKYITVMDDSVDHCVSFDGQGFSDKFIYKYHDQIAERQKKIENHNVDYDYVNLLLNDIGETKYYKGKDIGNGNGGFLENHCPNSFMGWNQDGSFTMEECPEGQPAEMKAVDEFLNNCLRSLPDSEKDKMLSMIHRFVMFGFSASKSTPETMWKDLKDIMHDPATADCLPYLLAYFIQYERANPEMAKLIRDFLEKFDLGDYCKYVDVVEQLLNHGIDIEIDLKMFKKTINISFDQILDIIRGIENVAVAGNIITKGWLLTKLADLVKEKTGLDVNQDDLSLVLNMVEKVDADMDRVRIRDDGADFRVPSVSPQSSSGSNSHGTDRHHKFRVKPERIRKAITDMTVISNELHVCTGNMIKCREKITFTTANTATIREASQRAEYHMSKVESKIKHLRKDLNEILSVYEKTEYRLKGQ